MKDRLHLAASAYYGLHRPSLCERRVYLLAHEEPQGEPSEFEQIIMELGKRHEQEHLAGFPEFRDLSDGNNADRALRTRDAVSKGTPVIYQGVLRAAFPGSRDVVTGIPDFLIKDGDSYCIRDCKLSRSMEGTKHPEIGLQLQTYGWLFEKTFDHPPAALEAFLGNRTIASAAYRGAEYAVQELGQIRGLQWLAPSGRKGSPRMISFLRRWTHARCSSSSGRGVRVSIGWEKRRTGYLRRPARFQAAR